MSVYTLLNGVTAVQALPAAVEGGAKGSNLPVGSLFVDLSAGGAGNAVALAANVSFHIVVKSNPAGISVSATVQPIASNDGIHWANDGSAISVTAGNAPVQATGTSTAAFAYRSALVTAISGTGASVFCYMNA